jgi:hypothetical protein
MNSTRKADRWNAQIIIGCLLGLIVGVFFFAAVSVLIIRRDRDIAHYPGATIITNHSNYSGLPYQINWNNSYISSDNFTTIYNWYSVKFDLGAESRAIERCILLEGPMDLYLLRRHISVLLCNTPQGQMIYVNRSTELKFNRR